MPSRTKLRRVLAVLCACLFTTASRAADLQAPSMALWIQPAPPLLFLAPLLFPPSTPRIIYIPVGASFATRGPLDLSFEASHFEEVSRIWGWSASAGALIHLSGGRALNGFFLQPKLIVTYLYASGVHDDPEEGLTRSPPNSTLSFELGVDFGFQATFGPLYIAPMLGVSGGVCTHCAGRETPSVWDTSWDYGSDGSGPKAVYGLNLNLLRIGAVF